MTADPSEGDPLTGARRLGGVSIGAPGDREDGLDIVVHLTVDFNVDVSLGGVFSE